jgi:uncharacterized membrane protein YbhN (UPF0104 family)
MLRLGVSVALLSWVAWRTDWQQVSAAFGRLRAELWLAAFGLLLASQFVSALRWRMLAQALRFQRSLWQYVGFYFIGMYFNLLLPTSVGGDVVRAWYLDGRSGRRLAAFAAVFLDRCSGLLVLLALACVAMICCPADLELPAWIPWFIWSAAGVALAGLILLPVLARHSKLARRRVHQARSAWTMLRSPRLLLGTTLLSLIVQAANVVIVWLVGLAIGAGVPAAYYWILVPMVSLLTLLPSIGGTGIREKSMIVFLAAVHIDEGVALTLSLLWFAVFVGGSLVGGFVYLFGRFPRPAPPGELANEGQTDEGPVGGDSDQGRAGQLEAAA